MQTHTQLADTNNKKSVTVLLNLADQVKPMNITLWLWYTVAIIRKKKLKLSCERTKRKQHTINKNDFS